jgi:hypothetical protein
MLQSDPKAIQKEMNRVGGAAQRATARTVQSMSLNAKDRTLEQIRQFDKPTPEMLTSRAYQAAVTLPAKVVLNARSPVTRHR